LFEWVVLKEGQLRVANHARFNVETTISNEDYSASTIDQRGRAAKNLTFGPGFRLRKLNLGEAFLFLQQLLGAHKCGVELDDSHEEDSG
jgi:hypothetical protein